MSLDIRLTDGTRFTETETKGPPTMPTEPTSTMPSATISVTPVRTRRDIFDELEAAEARCHEMAKALVLEREKAARLNVELRNFGKRTRAKRTP